MRSQRFATIAMMTVVMMAGSIVALAQSDSEFYRLTAPPPAQQLAADTTVIPAGQGAIFVPALSDGSDEPIVLVYSGETRVADGQTEARIPVPPGSYAVKVGSGAIKQMMEVAVEVAAGQTTMVQPTWAGLVIQVVDTQNIPHRGTYEIIRSEDRELFGLGYGADTLQGEPLQPWLLAPGLYRIVRSGETYRARKDFATVYLPQGSMVHYKLVIDPDTGDFRGSGVVSSEEIGVRPAGAASNWTHRAVISGAVTMASSSNYVGQADQTTYGGTAFLDGYSVYDDGPNFFSGLFELEEGFVRVEPKEGRTLPTQQVQDRLRLEGLYTRFIGEKWGPYARFGLLTNVFPSETLTTEPVAIAYNRLDGSRDVYAFDANDTYRTADSFGSLRFREGLGINGRLVRNEYLTLNARGGVGFRQNVYSNAFVVDNDPSTPELDLYEIDSFNQEGLEATLLATVRLTRLLTYIGDLEYFADFNDMSDPTIDWRNTVSLRLTRHVSLDYRYDYLDFPQISDKKQTRQNLLFRIAFDLVN